MFTCKTCVNMYSAIRTARYGPISRCSSLYIYNGASPELYDKGKYCTVHIALYMFTHVLQVNMHVFLACSDETHTNFTLVLMSGLAVG